MEERIILGIDPGTTIMGYGLIHCTGKSTIKLLAMGVLKLDKENDHPEKLKKIFHRVISLIEEFKPMELAIEAPFFGKNVQSMLKLGRAQGVAIAAALSKDLPIFEYSPKKIKQSITGNGNASKEMVAEMLKRSFPQQKLDDQYLDATDGLAAALCHFYQRGITPGSSASSWTAFISQNPSRVKG